MTGEPAALVLTSGRGQDRSALAAVRALSAAGYRPVVGDSRDNSLAMASRYVVGSFPLPDPQSLEFADVVGRAEADFKAVAVFPSNDDALLALDPGLESLMNKSQLADRASAAGLRVPPTMGFVTAAEVATAGKAVPYPAVVKPALKQTDLPSYLVERPDQLRVADHVGPVVVQPFLEGPTDAICGVMWSGRLVASVRQEYIRIWPRSCGTATAAIVGAPDPTRSAALTRLLTSYDGIFQAQFIGGALIDLNLRVYGSLPLAVGAGLNLPAIVCALSAGEDVVEPSVAVGSRYRWIEGDLRNRWQAIRTGEASIGRVVRDIAPRRNTAHSVVTRRDLKPVAARIRYAAASRQRGRSS